MRVRKVYNVYQTPKVLQEHMLRTAALAMVILESWIGIEVDKQSIIKACTIHDIAKPISFNLKKQTQFGMSVKDIEKLALLQIKLKAKYGRDEHYASIQIAKELNCKPNVIKLIDNLEWKLVPHFIKNNNINMLIPIYCDMRIGPWGILPLQTRLNELKKRTGKTIYQKNGASLEKIIAKNITINLKKITEDQLARQFNKLLSLELS